MRKKKVKDAVKVWSAMLVSGCKLDAVIYNTMINGFCKEGSLGLPRFSRPMLFAGIMEGLSALFGSLMLRPRVLLTTGYPLAISRTKVSKGY